MKNIKNKFIRLFLIGMQCMPINQVYAASDHDNDQVVRLSVAQRHEIIATKLANVKKSDDLNVKLLAAWINADKDIIEQMVDGAQGVAQKEKSDVLTMRHYEKAYYELNAGPEMGIFNLKRLTMHLTNDEQETALHEAAHLVACAHHPKIMALSGTIVPHQRALGLYQKIDLSENNDNWTNDDTRKEIVYQLAGPVAEQVFNIQNIDGVNKIWDTYICHPDYADVELSFEELVNRESAEGDLNCARPGISALVQYSCQLEGLDCSPENLDNEDAKAKYDEVSQQVMNECYQETVEFVQAHKPEIVKLAAVLYEKKYVSSDEIYEACGMTRPLLDIEKK